MSTWWPFLTLDLFSTWPSLSKQRALGTRSEHTVAWVVLTAVSATTSRRSCATRSGWWCRTSSTPQQPRDQLMVNSVRFTHSSATSSRPFLAWITSIRLPGKKLPVWMSYDISLKLYFLPELNNHNNYSLNILRIKFILAQKVVRFNMDRVNEQR